MVIRLSERKSLPGCTAEALGQLGHQGCILRACSNLAEGHQQQGLLAWDLDASRVMAGLAHPASLAQ